MTSFLSLTLCQWNEQAERTAGEIAEITPPEDLDESGLVEFAFAELLKRWKGPASWDVPPASILAAGARVWAADAISARCERMAMAAPDFDGERPDPDEGDR